MSYHKSDCLNVSTESDDSSDDAEGAIAAILNKLSGLGKKNSEENKVLVREFLSFDDEITLVEGMWSEVEDHLKSFKKDSSSTTAIQKYLKQDWEEFRALRRNHYRLCNKHLSNQDSDDNSSLNDFDITNWCEEDENDLNETCECHVCPNVPTNNSWKDSYSSKSRARKSDMSTSTKGQQPKNAEKEKKEVSTDTAEVHHNFCSKHGDPIKRIPCSDQDDDLAFEGNDDCTSDTSDTDSRHCDCCYCEVFGHGLPATAPMSRNYKEMRERLRLLLNKKKSKCKSTNSSPANSTPQNQPKRQQNGSANQEKQKSGLMKSDKSSAPNKAPPPPVVEDDTRDLEDLLDYIEGTEVKCRNEKKAAKKARQKEKKIQLLRKKKEEEEKARQLQEALAKKQREEELRLAKLKEQMQMNALKSKKKSKNRSQNSQKEQNAQQSQPKENPGSQMVTIKRIMEPHSSEPTVTITLRGATPKQDKVLYTLLNGQVCKVKDVLHESQQQHSKNENMKKSKNQVESNSVKIVKKTKQKKEMPQKPEPVPPPPVPTKQPVKPAKQLTNPTSIQINNAINTMSKHPTANFNIDDLKLPPGITITKVDASESQLNKKPKEAQNSKVNNAPPKSSPSSEVIVVNTNKLKEMSPNGGVRAEGNAKKKKQKKKDQDQKKCDKTSYPGLDIDPIPLASQNNNLVHQMSVLTINPYAGSKQVTEIKLDANKKKKKKSKKGNEPINNPDEWKMLDSVFAPKDIDLNDGEIDAAERELEAFKRFCLQSVPPERKAKVHLNLKDIVLKKKSSPVTCN